MVNVEDMSERVDEIRQIFINLRKFAKEEDECSTMMEKWLYNLKNMNRDDKVAFAERDEVFRKLRQYAEEKNMTDDEKILYDLRIDAWRDYYADMDESMAEGFERGKGHDCEEPEKHGDGDCGYCCGNGVDRRGSEGALRKSVGRAEMRSRGLGRVETRKDEQVSPLATLGRDDKKSPLTGSEDRRSDEGVEGL